MRSRRATGGHGRQAERIEWLHVEALAGVLALERLLLETVDILEQRNVRCGCSRGPPSPTSTTRTRRTVFGDIDLLVPGSDFDRAVDVGRAGHQRFHPEPRPGFDRRFSKGTSFRTTDGLEIDLHRSFTMGPFGVRLDLESVWERSESSGWATPAAGVAGRGALRPCLLPRSAR